MVGFIARCDNTGLGLESADFVRHVRPEKTLVRVTRKRREFPERVAGCVTTTFFENVPTPAQADEFLEGLHTLFCIETPYEWGIFEKAKQLGIRTILRINYEYLPDPVPVAPDVMIAPVDWHQPDAAMVLPFPVDRDSIPFRRRERARTFVHIAGRQGAFGRNGTVELLKAIPRVTSDVRFVIYSQHPLRRIDDPRVHFFIRDFTDRAELYREGDVLVFPRRYGGQALSMNEALSAGMPVMMTDMRPQSSFLPAELLIKPARIGKASFFDKRTVDMAFVEPETIAEKIDEWAEADISVFSDHADRYAHSISWTSLGPIYAEILRTPGWRPAAPSAPDDSESTGDAVRRGHVRGGAPPQ